MSLKVALVHYWLTTYGGGEKCIEALCELWPGADIFTLVYDPKIFVNSVISRHKVTPSFIDRLPLARKKFRHYFPLFPFAVEQFDLRGYDVVISSSSGFAHGVITDPHQLHLCYMHTPLRYAWSGYHEYMDHPEIRSRWKNGLTRMILHRIRTWDYLAAQRVDEFIANSREVQRRIWKYYRRQAHVIHPPIEVAKLAPASDQKKETFYLTFSRLVPYKRVDLIVEAFKAMPNHRLIVGGDGPELEKLKKMAQGAKHIEFIGFIPENEKINLLRQAKGFIFAAHEDFGMVPLEAQASGTPVIAFRKGGSLETVDENRTGVFFDLQSPESLIDAISRFEAIDFDPENLSAWVGRFSVNNFQNKIRNFVQTSWNIYTSNKDQDHE
ncbi:MAG: glycosyltransferase [Phycisphaerae bacterium]